MNREKFEEELAALQRPITLKGLCPDGPPAGRAVLQDGTIVPAQWDGVAALLREDETPGDMATAQRYRDALLAHRPAETPSQRERRRADLQNVALALVLKELRGGGIAPAWALTVIDELASRATDGV